MSRIRLLCVLFMSTLVGWAQEQPGLAFSSPETSIEHRFEFELQDFAYHNLMKITGEKMTLVPKRVIYNDQPLKVTSCKTRGNTTLLYRRKSLSLSLELPIDFQGVPVTKLAINNLAMDRNYWRARLCFLLMRQLEIFYLSNQFAELVINGRSQGTYLMIQKPEDYCRNIGSGLLVRREGIGKISIEHTLDVEAKKQVKTLKQIKVLPNQYSGKQLYDTLNRIIDFKAYAKWLGFNYLVMNGDYTDELFLFVDPETSRFQILPWDYDDVFASQPHEGQKRRDHKLGNQLLFSSEAPFDQVIAHDEFLYDVYLKIFKEVLMVMTPEVLKNSFQQVYGELYPFYSDPDIIVQSQYDHSGLTSIELLREDLNRHFELLVTRRNSLEIAIEH